MTLAAFQDAFGGLQIELREMIHSQMQEYFHNFTSLPGVASGGISRQVEYAPEEKTEYKEVTPPGRQALRTALGMMEDMLIKKGGEYTTQDEFENFQDQAKGGEMSMRQVFRGMIFQKLTREKSQHRQGYDALDSILDGANYFTLWLGWELLQRTIEEVERG
jgi:hypothetical protein